jgi:membrane-anchored protein YejM (alkaline phosphatase superfamily)
MGKCGNYPWFVAISIVDYNDLLYINDDARYVCLDRLDFWLGEYLDLLTEQQAMEVTIVCIASDHGEMLFDRGCTAKSRPWSSALSVPLICAGPAIAKDAVVTAAISTVDLARKNTRIRV